MKTLKLFVVFWLYLPFIVEAEEQQKVVILSPKEMFNYQAQNGGVRDLYDRDLYDGVKNKTLTKDFPLTPYKNSLEFIGKRKKFIGTGMLSLCIGHLFFQHILKKPVNQFLTYLLTKKSIPGDIKKYSRINRLIHLTHFIFDISSAFVGYKIAQLYELNKPTGELV